MSSGSVQVEAWVDGGARGNPGPAGYGVLVKLQGIGDIYQRAAWIGRTTNNQAEYRALLHCLEVLEEMELTEGVIHSDSELLVKHLSGEYRVKDQKLKPLYEEAVERLKRLGGISVVHVRRESNAEADRLANAGIDWGLAEHEETAGGSRVPSL